ncbi:SCNM1 protein, partial [Nothocercus julius]|nr:SCNM1 protein [Nothocercus julius]
MSFKREGDDPGQLGALQKRRVADLLASYIPEEEALLLRSGRYACTVCPHRPVFDTLAVLAVHRAGKKHVAGKWGGLGGGGGRRVGLLRERPALSRGNLSSVPSPQGLPAPLLARTRRIAQSALLKAAPYSSRCRRTGGAALAPGSRAAHFPACSSPGCASVSFFPCELILLSALPDTSKAAASRTRVGGKGKASLSPARQPQALSAERSQALERYLQLRSAGWIQDRSGKWVKDENVEFDSDEDEPPGLLLA